MSEGELCSPELVAGAAQGRGPLDAGEGRRGEEQHRVLHPAVARVGLAVAAGLEVQEDGAHHRAEPGAAHGAGPGWDQRIGGGATG